MAVSNRPQDFGHSVKSDEVGGKVRGNKPPNCRWTKTANLPLRSYSNCALIRGTWHRFGSQVISVLLFCRLSRYARILAIRTVLRPELHRVTCPQLDRRLRIRGHVLHDLAYPIAHLEDLPTRECLLG